MCVVNQTGKNLLMCSTLMFKLLSKMLSAFFSVDLYKFFNAFHQVHRFMVYDLIILNMHSISYATAPAPPIL